MVDPKQVKDSSILNSTQEIQSIQAGDDNILPERAWRDDHVEKYKEQYWTKIEIQVDEEEHSDNPIASEPEVVKQVDGWLDQNRLCCLLT